jgi:shikimate dehydrogenase
MMRRYAVIGNPVGHSLSPRIHQMFAEQTGRALEYTAILAPLDGFVRTLCSFFKSGGNGVNVTLPFKEAAYDWVTSCDEYAGSAGAVNTIVASNDGFRGCNTDGLGLVKDLTTNLGCTLADKRVLILGAGGAVRGILGPLLGASPRALVVANRTESRARALIERFEDPRLTATDLDALTEAFDIVVNATSAGLVGALPKVPAAAIAGSLVYDMVYGQNAEPFCRWAIEHGAARAVDGLGMLVEQAAEAFELFHGVRPDSAKVLRRLREDHR